MNIWIRNLESRRLREGCIRGRGREIVLSVAYYPDINEYRGNVSLQMVMEVLYVGN